jgi:hypothetical protein
VARSREFRATLDVVEPPMSVLSQTAIKQMPGRAGPLIIISAGVQNSL